MKHSIGRFIAAAFVMFLVLSLSVHLGYAQTQDPDAIIQKLKDPDPNVRMRVAFDLRDIKDARAVDALLLAMKDTDAVVRSIAIDSLSENGGARAVDPVIAALKDENASVRMVAANTLGALKDAKAVPPLIGALKDEETVRFMASRALEDIGDLRNVEPLMAALKSKDVAIVGGAFRFFIRKGEPGSEAVLIEALKKYGSGKSFLNQAMALIYYLSGNSQLERAGDDFNTSLSGRRFNESLKKENPLPFAPKWGSDRKK